ncbi:hypothetical protein [Pseudomonas sp. AAC]|uniref:hypothetical protein n=1 Tax=Pseudomonas sp. AAC TaxID=1502784 RepID=UPI0004D7974F|nr:hypothetical protein [Pseudomonas sp. AAC]KES23083.1 hypothetical protein FG99_16095 [Pseudomonas sp. AAC]
MKIAIYARDQHVAAEALAAGLKLHGHRAIFRSLPDYGDNCQEQFDLVMVVGLRGRGQRIFSEYTEAGVPVVVVDYGYLNRVNGVDDYVDGNWQVSLGGLNMIPAFECPPDRFEALGLSIRPPVERNGPVVLCGQVVGDAAHPFDTQEKLDEWIASVPHDEFRPHPLAGGEIEPLEGLFARASKIVTWNSNIGHDALLAGVPVEAHGPAPYANVDMKDREAYFARVAYGQWTVTEMEEGLASAFVLEKLLGQTAVAVPVDEVTNTLTETETETEQALTVVQKGRGNYSVVRADGTVVAEGLKKAAADALAKGKA